LEINRRLAFEEVRRKQPKSIPSMDDVLAALSGAVGEGQIGRASSSRDLRSRERVLRRGNGAGNFPVGCKGNRLVPDAVRLLRVRLRQDRAARFVQTFALKKGRIIADFPCEP
jgi:hypothetical protein